MKQLERVGSEWTGFNVGSGSGLFSGPGRTTAAVWSLCKSRTVLVVRLIHRQEEFAPNRVLELRWGLRFQRAVRSGPIIRSDSGGLPESLLVLFS